jgi:hypothetical protein
LSYPEPPWQLGGEITVVPALTSRRRLGGVLLADYQTGTLQYRELIVFSHVTRRGVVVSHIYVDSPESMRGGIAIWGLPKELAAFELEGSRFVVRQAGNLLLSASVRRRSGKLPIVIPAPITSHVGQTIGTARIKAAPALVTLTIPETSPFAHLGLDGTHVALAGDDLRLKMPAPRRR